MITAAPAWDVIDLFCKQGGAGEGYRRAGFSVTGVDIAPQPRNPHPFVLADALGILRGMITAPGPVRSRLLGHASPPCQAFTSAWTIRRGDHPDLIGPVRDCFEHLGLPYVIENVPGAPLRNTVMLCGTMFGLRTYRHRLFETNFPVAQPPHPPHLHRTAEMGRPAAEGEFLTIVGNFSGAQAARDAMDCQWMSRDGLREAIPPAYTEYIGTQFLLSQSLAAHPAGKAMR